MSDRVKHVKHRSCTSCGKERPAVLFPKFKNGGYRKTCQLCVDTKKAAPKDVMALRLKGRRAQERRAVMVKANRKVSAPHARTRAREPLGNASETVGEGRETV